uniref:Uncharacterized protein n=1 Tax=Ananas comosus var. bracteatus TaxID=296719 RepID=A0A6V7PM95_ANACO|nr:unnamed protein product [Ananas comosus var. bracteatus]
MKACPIHFNESSFDPHPSKMKAHSRSIWHGSLDSENATAAAIHCQEGSDLEKRECFLRTTHLQRNGMVALVLAGTYTFDVICLILSGVLVGAVAYQGWRDFVHPMLQKIRSLQAMANQLDKQQNERSLPFQYFYRFIMWKFWLVCFYSGSHLLQVSKPRVMNKGHLLQSISIHILISIDSYFEPNVPVDQMEVSAIHDISFIAKSEPSLFSILSSFYLAEGKGLGHICFAGKWDGNSDFLQ